MGKNYPLKTAALAVDEKEKAIESSHGRAQSWWRPSWVWEARVDCWSHGKVAWKSNEPTKWKTSTNEDKWTTTTTKWTKMKKISRGSPKQVPSLGVFDYFMVIGDNFIIYVNNYLWLLWLVVIILWLLVIISDYWLLFMIIDYLLL